MRIAPVFFIISIILTGAAAILTRFYYKPKSVYTILKAATTSLIILCSASAFCSNDPKDCLLTALIAGGLVFSLAGDITICTERKLFFLVSLVCFSCTHLVYAAAFFLHTRIDIPDLFTGILILAAGFFVFRLLYPQLKKLKIPVFCYTFIISLSAWLGISMLFSPHLSPARRIFIAAGATLFYVSDIILGINMFSRSSRLFIPLNLVLYYLGQTLIALSCYSFF